MKFAEWWPGPQRLCDRCGLPFLTSPNSSLVCKPCQALTLRSADKGVDRLEPVCDDPQA